jgi:hypothetical protein
MVVDARRSSQPEAVGLQHNQHGGRRQQHDRRDPPAADRAPSYVKQKRLGGGRFTAAHRTVPARTRCATQRINEGTSSQTHSTHRKWGASSAGAG